MQYLDNVTTPSIAILGEGGRGIESGFSGGRFVLEHDDSMHSVVCMS